MDNFTFTNPTKIIFGRGTENKVGKEAAAYSNKVLLHYGSGSIKASGLYDRVTASLREASVEIVELPGVKANPSLSLVQEGIRICHEQNIPFILAVGGGSVIDSAKGIAAGVMYGGDVWDLYTDKARVKSALPVGTVLTIPAAGSEASTGTVITKEEGMLKRAFNSTHVIPRFSILNPELAFTLPPYQAACGAVDIMSHLLERYFTNTRHVELTDRLIEGALVTIIHNAPVVIEQPQNYNAWAEIMWTGTVAHNNLLDTGRKGDWATHLIEHEISGIYDIAHGAGLAMMFPAWMRYVYKHNLNRFVQLAVRVWNVEQDHFDPEPTALAGIEKLEAFWGSLGLPTRIRAAGLDNSSFEEMAAKCTADNKNTVGNFVKLNKEDVIKIYNLAY
ncbi:MAG: NADH-dependent alcohol dehydrogenase [Anaerolinea sp.]|nr:NADH-dependent alcohol dehydrogenase [Anaerolinea sp.]